MSVYRTSIYLDDLLNVDNPCYEGMVNQNISTVTAIEANTSVTVAPFWIYTYLFLTVLFPPKIIIKVITLLLI